MREIGFWRMILIALCLPVYLVGFALYAVAAMLMFPMYWLAHAHARLVVRQDEETQESDSGNPPRHHSVSN